MIVVIADAWNLEERYIKSFHIHTAKLPRNEWARSKSGCGFPSRVTTKVVKSNHMSSSSASKAY